MLFNNLSLVKYDKENDIWSHGLFNPLKKENWKKALGGGKELQVEQLNNQFSNSYKLDDGTTDYDKFSIVPEDIGLSKTNIEYYKEFIEYAKDEQLNLAEMTANEVSEAYTKWGEEIKGVGKEGATAQKIMGGLKGIGASLASAGLSMLASTVISKGIEWLSEIIVTSKEAEQALEEVTDAWNDAHKDIAKNEAQLPELEKEYERLSKGVDELGNNVSLTKDEYNKYLEMVESISSIMPNLTTYFNEQGQAIGFVGQELSDTLKLYRQYRHEEAREKFEDDDSWKEIKNSTEAVNDPNTKTSISKLQQQRYVKKLVSDGKTPTEAIKKAVETYQEPIELENGDQIYYDFDQDKVVVRLFDTGMVTDIDSIDSGDYTDIKKGEYGKKGLDTILKWDSQKFVKDVQEGNQHHSKMLLTALEANDEFAELSTDTINGITSFINTFNWQESGVGFELNNPEDYKSLMAQIVKGVQKDEKVFVDAINDINSKELAELPIAEAEEKRDEYIKTILGAFGINPDNPNLSDENKKVVESLKISFGMELDEDGNQITQEELLQLAHESTGIPIDELKKLFNVGELKYFASVNFSIEENEKVIAGRNGKVDINSEENREKISNLKARAINDTWR